MEQIKTGFRDIDNKIGTLKNLICISTLKEVGRTTLTLNVILNVIEQRKNILFFSLTDMKYLVEQKLINMENQTTMNVLETTKQLVELLEKHLFINDHISDISGIEQKVKELKAQKNIDLIVIDYLQRIENDTSTEDVIKRLYTLSKELNIPIILVSLLSSNNIKLRRDKKPRLTDLENSTSITKYANIILLVHKEEIYNKYTEKLHIVDVIIAKNTNENIGTVELLDIRTRYKDLWRDTSV